MNVGGIDHVNIRAPERLIEEIRVFYRDLLGLVPGPRPAQSKPGYWLYAQDHPLVHLTIVADADGSEDAKPTGRIGHLAFACTDLAETKRRLAVMGVEYREGVVPALQQAQLFFVDPAGIRVELNFAQPGV